MIPEAAVEAAELVLIAHQRRDNSSCLCGWAKLGASHPLHQAQIVLEAAAPHMLAEAWDRAVASMVYDDGTPLEIMSNNNPYRIAK